MLSLVIGANPCRVKTLFASKVIGSEWAYFIIGLHATPNSDGVAYGITERTLYGL